MKKILCFLAFAAVLCISCNKQQPAPQVEDPLDSSYTVPRLEAPVNKDNHFLMLVSPELPQEGMVNPDGEPDKITEILLPPGPTGIVVYENAGPKAFSFQLQESKVSAGLKFLTSGAFQSLSVNGIDSNDISASAEVNGKDVPLYGTIQEEEQYTPYRQDVCRVWSIEETIISFRGDGVPGDLGVGSKFNGGSISEIVSYANEKGFEIDAVGPEYDVTAIMIDPSGKFGISFAGKDPYYGDYTLKGTIFNYSLTPSEGGSVAGHVSGRLTATNGYGRLELKADLKDSSGKKYSVDVILKMKSKNRG